MTSRGHLVQPLSQTRASSSWILNISVDRDSITSLDSIFQCLTKFMIKNKLMFSFFGITCMPACIHYVSSHLTDMWEECVSICAVPSPSHLKADKIQFSLSCSLHVLCSSPVPSWWLSARLTGVCLCPSYNGDPQPGHILHVWSQKGLSKSHGHQRSVPTSTILWYLLVCFSALPRSLKTAVLPSSVFLTPSS